MRIGVVILPEARWAEVRPRWEAAEALGFDHAWTYDHLTWRGFRDEAWFGAVTTLAAAAAVTSTIRLGPLVASPNFRHPVPFAKDLIGLDDLSGGRITLGIGSGGTGWDATVLGQEPWSPKERADRFEEFVGLTHRLLTEPAIDHVGTHYGASGARTIPGCVQQPRLPFAVAATGPRAMRLAATYGQAWVTTGPEEDRVLTAPDGAAVVARQVARLEAASAAIDRDPATIDRLVLTGLSLDPGLGSPEQFEDLVGHYEAVGITDLVVHWPRSTDPYRGDEPTFERIFSSRT